MDALGDQLPLEQPEPELRPHYRCFGLQFLSYKHIGVKLSPAFLLDYIRHIIRGAETNLSRMVVSDTEAEFLAGKKGIDGVYAQNFLSYRRSALVALIIPLIVNFGAGFLERLNQSRLVDQTVDQYGDDPRVSTALLLFAALQWSMYAITIGALVSVVAAILTWHKYRWSRFFVAIAWAIFFFTPYLASLGPYGLLAGDLIEQLFDLPENSFALLAGLYFFMLLAPSVLTLFPSLIRGAIVARTLFPTSPIPGSFAASVPLFLAPITWVAFIILYHVTPSVTLLFAIFIYASSTLLFLLFVDRLTKPLMMTGRRSAQDYVRMIYYVLLLVFFGLVAYWATVEVGIFSFGVVNVFRDLVLRPVTIVRFIASFISQYYLTNVFASDLMVRVIIKSERIDDMLHDGKHDDMLQMVHFRLRQFQGLFAARPKLRRKSKDPDQAKDDFDHVDERNLAEEGTVDSAAIADDQVKLHLGDAEELKHYRCCGIPFLGSDRVDVQNGLWELLSPLAFLRHAIRGTQKNLTASVASPAEVQFLDGIGVTGFYAQNFLAYRRSTLRALMLPLILAFGFAVYNQFSQTGNAIRFLNSSALQQDLRNALLTFELLQWGVLGLTMLSFVFVLRASVLWHDYRRSKLAVQRGWIIFFFAPFVASVPPYQLLAADAARKLGAPPITVGIVVGLYFFALLAPSVLTLAPSLSRGALTVRTLFSTSVIPGFFMASIPLFMSPITWVVFVFVYQLVPSLWLLSALLVYTLSTMVFLFAQRWTTWPTVYRGNLPVSLSVVQYLYFALFVVSGVLMLVYAVEIFGPRGFLAAWRDFIVDFRLLIAKTAMSFIAQYYLTNVFSSDLILGIILRSENTSVLLRDGDHNEMLRAKTKRVRDLNLIVPASKLD